MLWLSQMRAGVAKPEFVERTPGEGWPQPLLLYMRGEYTEDELTTPILEGDDEYNPQPNTSTDERLCEALFYVGEAYWARGQLDVARDYFAPLVNIKVIYFLEHGLALAGSRSCANGHRLERNCRLLRARFAQQMRICPIHRVVSARFRARRICSS